MTTSYTVKITKWDKRKNRSYSFASKDAAADFARNQIGIMAAQLYQGSVLIAHRLGYESRLTWM